MGVTSDKFKKIESKYVFMSLQVSPLAAEKGVESTTKYQNMSFSAPLGLRSQRMKFGEKVGHN